jgi:uncharacterized protein YbaA (DUF1428 family)
MDRLQKLHPFGANTQKQFLKVVEAASDEEVLAAWASWKDQYSRNFRAIIGARVAQIERQRRNQARAVEPSRPEHTW